MKIKLTDIDANLREMPSITGQANKVLAVNPAGNGLVWKTDAVGAGLTDAPQDGGRYVRQNGAWVEDESGGGNADYPDFLGNAGKVLKVNSTENGVEWAIDGGGSSDLPPITGQAGRVLKVNAGGTGLEWDVDSRGILDAPSNGSKYARQDGAWVSIQEGLDGEDGRGISGVSRSGNNLIVAFTDGATTDVGNIKGDKGDIGATGPGVPVGGYTGQVLAKINGEDFNTGWIDPPEGGGGGEPTDPSLDYPAWGEVVATINQTFDSGIIPTNITWKNGISGTIVTQPDVGPSTTKAMQFPTGGIEYNGDGWFEIVAVADAVHYDVKIRYLTQGEHGYDGLRINLNGGEIYQDRTYNEVFKEFSFTLSPGTHVIRFRYTSDYAATAGFQNTRFSQILYPGLQSTVVYNHGDTVHHNGFVWMCIYDGTNEEPGTGEHWARFEKKDNRNIPALSGANRLLRINSTNNNIAWSPISSTGSASTHGAHRYWGVFVTANNGTGSGNVAMSEIEFATVPGSVNLVDGNGVAGGSNPIGGEWVVANAFDSNPNTMFNTTAAPAIAYYDFGSGQAKTVSEVRIRARPDFLSDSPKDFTVRYSDNGTDWTIAWAVTDAIAWGSLEIRSFVDPAYDPDPLVLGNINILSDVDTLTTPPQNGAALIWQASSNTWVPSQDAAKYYRIGGFFVDTPDANETLMMHVVNHSIVIPANLVGSSFSVDTPPTASADFYIFQNSTQRGTISVSTAGVVTVVCPQLTLSVGTVIKIVSSADSKGTIGMAWTIRAVEA